MEVFQEKLQIHIAGEKYDENHQIQKIASQWKKISALDCTDEANLSVETREAIHDTIDSTTEYLLSLTQQEVLSVLVAHITKVVEILDDPNSPLNTIVLANKEDSLLNEYFNVVRPSVVGSKGESRNTIWISLVFRMFCWLLLHDFDRADVNIVPSDLKGSRMPVYIG